MRGWERSFAQCDFMKGGYTMAVFHDTEYSISEMLAHEEGGSINKTIDSLPELRMIGDLLKEGRQKRGLSQKELADLTGVKNFEISRIESGVTIKPSKETLIALAPYIGLPYSELLLRCGYSGVDTNQIYYFTKGRIIDCDKVIADLYSTDFEIIELLEGVGRYDREDILLLKDFLHILDTSAELRLKSDVNCSSARILLDTVNNAIKWLQSYLNSMRMVLAKQFI